MKHQPDVTLRGWSARRPRSTFALSEDTMSHEFTGEQNDLIGRLASKMSVVGLVSILFGVVYLLSAVLLLGFVFQDRLPAEVVSKIPDEVRSKVPSTNYLWGVIAQTLLAGVIFLLIGLWTRSSGSSFREIVATTGRDIAHLMSALSSLHKMYSLVYTLIIVTLIVVVVAIGLQLYLRYGTA
jgi:hypothetical protein